MVGYRCPSDAVSKSVPAHFKLDLDPNGFAPERFRCDPGDEEIGTVLERGDVRGHLSRRTMYWVTNRSVKTVNRPIAMHFGSPPYITGIREGVCDGFVIGGGKSEVVRARCF